MPDSIVLQKNDVGIQFVVTITSDGSTPIDISQCSNFTIIFTTPKGVTYSVAASFLNNGTDGKIQYVSTSSDLTISGRWKMQASYLKGVYIRYTSIDTFIVEENL